MNNPEQSLILIPVGRSPIHSYRICKSIMQSFKKIVFVCSTETFDYGKKLVGILGTGEIVAEQFEGFDVTKHITSDVDSINLILGPGKFEMSLGLVELIIRHTKKSPILWVTHQRLTKSKNVIGEQLVDIGKIDRKISLCEVSKITACEILGIQDSEEVYEKLVWNSKTSKFTYKILIDEGIRLKKKESAEKWAQGEISIVDDLKKQYGKHSIVFTRDELPARPRYWLNIGYKMNDHGIRGGHSAWGKR